MYARIALNDLTINQGGKRRKRMTQCEKCTDKICLKTKKPCEAVEELLRKDKIYSANFLRPQMPSGKKGKGIYSQWREIPFSSLSSVTKRKYGVD